MLYSARIITLYSISIYLFTLFMVFVFIIGVCVEDLDHHCPWCSKCIGKNNMMFFKAFLAILCFQCYFLIGSLVYYFIALSKKAPLPIGPQFPSYS